MRKIFIACICIFIFVTLPLFAKWKIGNVVDAFGDPTGEKFVYTIVDGDFSNSATKSSPCSVRVLAQFEVTHFPLEEWVFEVHEYGFDNPINNFGTSIGANMLFKDDLGKIYTYHTSNFKNATNYWNTITGPEASEITKLFSNNQKINVSIFCESTRYKFEIPTNGVKELLNSVKNSIPSNTRKWIIEYPSPLILDLQDYYNDLYKENLGMNIEFPLYSWNYYDIVDVAGNLYQIHLIVDDEDLALHGYADLRIYANSLDENMRTAKSYGNLKKVNFIIDGKEYSLVVEEAENGVAFRKMLEMKNIIKALESSAFTSISLLFVENKSPLTITVDGKEMARIFASFL